MIRTWLSALGISLGLTLLVELSAARIAGKKRKALAIVGLVNILTNPVAVFSTLLWRWYHLPGIFWLIAAMELTAWLIEGRIYRCWRNDFPHPWRLSLLLNLLSFGTGELLKLII